MLNESYYYLLLMTFSLSVPLLRSFEKRISYYRSFKALFTSIFLVGVPFIIWDALFTHYGFWGFNPRYLSGMYGLGLPLGEWLFFIIIPYVCIFIFRVTEYFAPVSAERKWPRQITNFLLGFCGFMSVMYYDRWYTVLTFGFLFLLLLWHYRLNHTTWLGTFYRAFAIILIPFFLVNGILTGSGIAEEIVWYNAAEMVGQRIVTIPLEDGFYGMLLILGNLSIYQHLRKRPFFNTPLPNRAPR